MKLFALRDTKAEAFNRPFCSATRLTAQREIQHGLAENNMLRTFAMDYTLYEVGSFDEETGRITPCPDPYHVIDVSELVQDVESETVETTPQLGVA